MGAAQSSVKQLSCDNHGMARSGHSASRCVRILLSRAGISGGFCIPTSTAIAFLTHLPVLKRASFHPRATRAPLSLGQWLDSMDSLLTGITIDANATCRAGKQGNNDTNREWWPGSLVALAMLRHARRTATLTRKASHTMTTFGTRGMRLPLLEGSAEGRGRQRRSAVWLLSHFFHRGWAGQALRSR